MARLIGVVPARGGSKRIPRKNIVDLGGKPLVMWTLSFAEKLGFHVVVNTDDEEIAEVCKDYADEVFIRPESIHQSHAINPTLDTCTLMELSDDDVVALLLPTCPFRNPAEAVKAVNRIDEALSVVGIEPTKPYHSLRWMAENGRIVPMRNALDLNAESQTVEQLYTVNGSLFVARAGVLRQYKTFHTPNTIGHVMHPVIDINTMTDLERARNHLV